MIFFFFFTIILQVEIILINKNHFKYKFINRKFPCKGIILNSQVNLAMEINLVIFNTLRER